jgi:DNA primase
MARISPDEVERLKKEVSLVRLVEAEGIELKGHGENLLGLCRFHADKTPSLVVSPSKNLWNCLGACQKGGDVIAWVMAARGVSFRHAVELLRADSPGMTAAEPRKRVLPAPVAVEAEDREVLAQVVGFYHDTLKQSPEALAYLESRGLNHPELVDRFKLGFANRSLAYRLPPMATAAGSAVRTRLQRIGVLRESGHEHFNGSLVVPIWNEHGHVLGLYGRKITSNLRKGTPLHLYLPGPHRGVFNVEALEASKTIILCEALIDALTFWCAGFCNVTTSYGVAASRPICWKPSSNTARSRYCSPTIATRPATPQRKHCPSG